MRKKYLLLLVFSALLTGLKAQTDTTSMKGNSSVTDDPNFPVLNINDAEFEEGSPSGDISGILSSSRDVFVSTAGYNFGRTRFRIRGYDSQYSNVLFNGITTNDPITGRAYWSVWGGLNDVTRNKTVINGIDNIEFDFGGVGGATNITARPSTMYPGFRFTYSQLNGSYRSRLMGTYSTGMMKNGWAFTVSGSRRWANEGYVKGTFYDAWAYFIGIEKKFNDNHSIALTSFGSPSKRGKSGVSTDEAYELAGTNYYNPNWGYQNGEIRNARTSDAHQPMIILTDYLDLSDRTKLTTSVAYSFGHYNTTSLNWHGYKDPRPDYYKNLPSYFLNKGDMDEYQLAMDKWSTEAGRQLDWDFMINLNQGNLATIENANALWTGQYDDNGNRIYTEGETISDKKRSNYIVEERVAERNRWNFSSVLNSAINERLALTGGINGSIYKQRDYKRVDDLLGGDFFVDVDKFAERDFPSEDYAQSDVRIKNHVVYEGDKFGYDYTSNINQFSAFGLANFTLSKFDFYLGASLGNTTFWRTGHMQNGKYPENSLGDSEKKSFFEYGLKGGATYKISGRHYIDANALYMTKAPVFRTAFISPRTRNSIVDNLKTENILSGDISYILRHPNFKGRATLYYTKFTDQTWQRSFYHDGYSSYINYVMSDLDAVSTGLEFGAEAKLSPSLVATGVLGLGHNVYANDPTVTVAADNGQKIPSGVSGSNELVDQKVTTSYLKGFNIGGSPQNAASLGLKYNSSKNWYVGANANYFWEIFTSLNPDRRSAEAVDGYVIEDNPEYWEDIVAQEELDPGMTVDLFGGMKWYIKDYQIRLNANINNIFDVQDFAIGGFEQLRYDRSNLNRFPNKHFYLYGRSYYISLTFSF